MKISPEKRQLLFARVKDLSKKFLQEEMGLIFQRCEPYQQVIFDRLLYHSEQIILQQEKMILLEQQVTLLIRYCVKDNERVKSIIRDYLYVPDH